LSTLVAVYFLVLVGGVVRSTGSGMGCPDWPTCFGKWIPPTSVNELPPDYKAQNAAYREKKNQKFARYLSMIGLQETSKKILEDKSILAETDFNATKAWVEYINRLVGVTIGLFIILLFITSWGSRVSAPEIFLGSMAALILVIVQGWFGSIVVSTNLTSWTITVHMFLALLLIALLIWLMVRSGEKRIAPFKGVRIWLAGGLVALLAQIFLGTEVRSALDKLAYTLGRDQWITNAGDDFIAHRSFSWVMVLFLAGLWYKFRKTTHEISLTLVPFLLILASLLTGAGMAYFAVPASLQPVHLLLAVVTFGWLFQLFLQMNPRQAELSKN
jgi:cytochrome c oxidase assembly protein subunit 15